MYKRFSFYKNIEKKLDFSIEFNKIYSDLYYVAKSGNASKSEFIIGHKDKDYLIKKKKEYVFAVLLKTRIYMPENLLNTIIYWVLIK